MGEISGKLRFNFPPIAVAIELRLDSDCRTSIPKGWVFNLICVEKDDDERELNAGVGITVFWRENELEEEDGLSTVTIAEAIDHGNENNTTVDVSRLTLTETKIEMNESDKENIEVD